MVETRMAEAVVEIVRRHGKPLDYFRLGKSFRDGADFMEHMKASAQGALERAIAHNTTRCVERCPICGHGGSVERLTVFGYPYRQCDAPGCRHVFVGTLVDPALRDEFFREDEAYSRRNYCDPKKSSFRLEHIARPKMEHILEFAPEGGSHWLDIGCGSGEILAVLRDHGGWSGVGLERSSRDAAFGREHYSVDIRKQLLADYRAEHPDAAFDVIALMGVLHCVEQPVELLREAAALLAPNGIVAVEITNYESLVTRAVEHFPDHPTRSCYNGLTTLHQFTEASIRRCFAAVGLDPVSVWYFGTDAFELLNQLCFSDPSFAESALMTALVEYANDLQRAIDQREQSSNMLWIASNR